jgi:hypothetical protein
MTTTLEDEQKTWCAAREIPYFGLDLAKKVGISRELLDDPFAASPLQGIRHTPSATTTGWFLWSGENDGSPNFFLPMHAEHLLARHRHLLPLLGGAPGWCFILAPDDDNYEDVWFDASIASTIG